MDRHQKPRHYSDGSPSRSGLLFGMLVLPNGIELISFTLDVSGVKLEFKVAGAAGVKSLLEPEEIGGGLTGEVPQEVTEEQ
jgi:hypothetical protein